MLAGATTSVIGTVCWALLDRRRSRDQQMRIVARNPVVIGDIRFEDGPYGSLNDAKLARPTIGACSEDDRRAG
jgi:hypothetical protein